MSIFLPKYIQFMLIKQKKQLKYILFLYNSKQYISLLTQNIFFLKTTNTLILNQYVCLSSYTIGSYLVNYLYIWDLFFLKKIKFKGKGYKILKNKKTLFLIFNHSHITWFIFFRICTLRLSKSKYIFMYKNLLKLTALIRQIYNIRPINTFTTRGIRIAKQTVLKKTGKRTT